MKTATRLCIVMMMFAGFSACKKSDKQSNLTLRLNGLVGSQPLSFTNTIYTDSLGKEFYFSTLQFYISHLKLIKSDNSSVEVSEVAFFDYSDNDWKVLSIDVPLGDYKGLEFYVGLDSIQNETKPDDYPASNPLGPKNNMYWSWLKHRFVNLEGRADTSGQNFSGGSTGLNYHVGRDTCYRKVTLTGNSFTIVDGAGRTLNLNVDVLKIFYGDSGTLDMFSESGTQSEDSDLNIAIKFADQFCKTFSYSE